MIALSAGSGKWPARECSATSRISPPPTSRNACDHRLGRRSQRRMLCARRSATPGRSQLPDQPDQAEAVVVAQVGDRVREERRVVGVARSGPSSPSTFGFCVSLWECRSTCSSSAELDFDRVVDRLRALGRLAAEDPAGDADERPHAPQLQREAVAAVAAGRDPDQPDVVVDGRRRAGRWPVICQVRWLIDQLVRRRGRLVAPRRQLRRDERRGRGDELVDLPAQADDLARCSGDPCGCRRSGSGCRAGRVAAERALEDRAEAVGLLEVDQRAVGLAAAGLQQRLREDEDARAR